MSAKRVAVCQMTSVGDKSQNMQVVSQLINNAVKDNALVGNQRKNFPVAFF